MTGDVDPKAFLTTWVQSCTIAEGRATTVKAEFLGRRLYVEPFN